MGIFGPAPSIIDAGAAAVEGVRRLQEYMDGDDYESLTDEELKEWAQENGFNYRREEGVVYLEPETQEAEQVLEETEADQEDFPMARRMLESGPKIWALEAGQEENRYEDDYQEGNDTGGENMTEDTDVPENVLSQDHLVATGAGYANNGEYDEEDVDAEALGAAVYIERIESDEADVDVAFEDLVEYIAEQGEDFNFGQMIEYKAELGDRDYDQFPDEVGDVVDEANDTREEIRATGAIYQALYEEAIAENEDARGAIGGMLDEVSDLDRSTPWLDDAADLDEAVANEQEAQEQFEELEGKLEDL